MANARRPLRRDLTDGLAALEAYLDLRVLRSRLPDGRADDLLSDSAWDEAHLLWCIPESVAL